MPDSLADRGQRRIVLGIGNPERGDDAAGLAVVRLLRGTLPKGSELFEQDGEATTLLAQIEGVAAAFLVDACVSGARPGTVHRFDVGTGPLPHAAFHLSTHGFGLCETIELARALGQLPDHCVVYAIEGSAFTPGAPLSPPVAAGVAAVAGRLRHELMGHEEPREHLHA